MKWKIKREEIKGGSTQKRWELMMLNSHVRQVACNLTNYAQYTTALLTPLKLVCYFWGLNLLGFNELEE